MLFRRFWQDPQSPRTDPSEGINRWHFRPPLSRQIATARILIPIPIPGFHFRLVRLLWDCMPGFSRPAGFWRRSLLTGLRALSGNPRQPLTGRRFANYMKRTCRREPGPLSYPLTAAKTSFVPSSECGTSSMVYMSQARLIRHQQTARLMSVSIHHPAMRSSCLHAGQPGRLLSRRQATRRISSTLLTLHAVQRAA